MNPLKRLSAGLLAAVVYLASLPIAPVALVAPAVLLTGCPVTSATAKDFANAFIASAKAIVAADPSASYVPALNTAIADAEAALAGWNGSSVNCALASAVNTAIQIINSIDANSQVALIATVAVAAFDALAAVLFPCTTPAIKALAIGGGNLRATEAVAYSGYLNQFKGAHLEVHAYKSAFNGAAKASGLVVRI